MISVELVPNHLTVDTPTDVLLRVTSTGESRYFSIVLEVEPRPGLLLEDGDSLILLDELGPHLPPQERSLRVRAQKPGKLQLAIVNFSYRDALFQPGRRKGELLEITADDRGPQESRKSAQTEGQPTRDPAAPRHTVFVSHRRAESTWFVSLLFNSLSDSLKRSRIFVDEQSISGGEKFPIRLDQELRRSIALLALIGPRWETIAIADGTRRITRDDDYVRREIATALSLDVLVVPVLFGGAKMPDKAGLPGDLQALTDRHAEVVENRTARADLRRIAALLRSHGLR